MGKEDITEFKTRAQNIEERPKANEYDKRKITKKFTALYR